MFDDVDIMKPAVKPPSPVTMVEQTNPMKISFASDNFEHVEKTALLQLHLNLAERNEIMAPKQVTIARYMGLL